MLLMKNIGGMRRAIAISEEDAAKMVEKGAATTTYHTGIIEEVAEYQHKEMTPAPKRRSKPKKVESDADESSE